MASKGIPDSGLVLATCPEAMTGAAAGSPSKANSVAIVLAGGVLAVGAIAWLLGRRERAVNVMGAAPTVLAVAGIRREDSSYGVVSDGKEPGTG